jgi:hypothetical protein
MNLSNLYFGGFRNNHPYHFDFKQAFEPGPYKNGLVEYSVDKEGIITQFKAEGLK